jgi:regulatory protein
MPQSPPSIHELNSDLFESEAELESDRRLGSANEARKKAMDFLARREYGFVELQNKLTQSGYTSAAVTQALEQLRAEGLQNDARFAESFIRSRIDQGKGPTRIRADLVQRGLAAEVIDATLEATAEDWHALARQVRERKFGVGLPEAFKEKARQMRFLQYRGFEQAHIQAAVSACNY